MKTREEYLSTLSVGNIIAFKVGDNMFSGKVESIVRDTELGHIIMIKTKNGSVYYPHLSEIVWIKNGSRWPIGIFNALKATKNRKT